MQWYLFQHERLPELLVTAYTWKAVYNAGCPYMPKMTTTTAFQTAAHDNATVLRNMDLLLTSDTTHIIMDELSLISREHMANISSHLNMYKHKPDEHFGDLRTSAYGYPNQHRPPGGGHPLFFGVGHTPDERV